MTDAKENPPIVWIRSVSGGPCVKRLGPFPVMLLRGEDMSLEEILGLRCALVCTLSEHAEMNTLFD